MHLAACTTMTMVTNRLKQEEKLEGLPPTTSRSSQDDQPGLIGSNEQRVEDAGKEQSKLG